MSLLVTGSIGIDTVESPSGKVENALGGSSIYFAYAGSFFSPVRLVGVVGEDCPHDFCAAARQRPHRHERAGGPQGLPHVPLARPLPPGRQQPQHRRGRGQRAGRAGPTIPAAFRDSRYAFLANTHPALQMQMLGELHKPCMVVADTMDRGSAPGAALRELIKHSTAWCSTTARQKCSPARPTSSRPALN